MGNITSLLESEKNEGNKTFGQVLDYIATYYILTMDFQSLTKLNDKQYCDNLIILTSDILDRYFTNNEITYLEQRIKDGVEVNDMAKDKVLFFSKEELGKTDISNSTKKKRVCIGVAKFYIKIAHLFAAIVTTINPVYIYKDETGNTVKKKLFEKDQIPPRVKRKLYKLGICDNRINALKHGQKMDTDDVKTIHPKVCDINTGNDGNTKNLEDEPGVPELMDLYLDKYDYTSGTFIGMTDETRRQYTKDLESFYRVFTGNSEMPPTVQQFSDIKLKDFHKLEACSGPNAALRTSVKLDKQMNKDDVKQKLFEDYARNLKQMVRSVNKNQADLLEVINEIFTYVIDPQTKKKRIIIHPKLSETSLQSVVVKTRKIIVNLYLKCETDYALGVKIYQAIVENQIKDTTLNQINTLEKETEKLINIEPKPFFGLGVPEKNESPEVDDQDEIEKQLNEEIPEDFKESSTEEIPSESSDDYSEEFRDSAPPTSSEEYSEEFNTPKPEDPTTLISDEYSEEFNQPKPEEIPPTSISEEYSEEFNTPKPEDPTTPINDDYSEEFNPPKPEEMPPTSSDEYSEELSPVRESIPEEMTPSSYPRR
jgi:hypothetical protein